MGRMEKKLHRRGRRIYGREEIHFQQKEMASSLPRNAVHDFTSMLFRDEEISDGDLSTETQGLSVHRNADGRKQTPGTGMGSAWVQCL